METARQNVYYKMKVPEEELTEEERERYKKATEIYEYRRNRVSTHLSVKEIFEFLKEWDEARMKIKKAYNW